MSQFLENLNPQQKEAVLDFSNPLLVLAGAGSGKTRVLTNKIAYGLSNQIIGPQNFLAVTFTNKAAGEMKHRISSMIEGTSLKDSWVSTFHSFGNRVLRSHVTSLGYTTDFTIYDSTDQISVVKTILKELRYDNSASNARKISRQIQSVKSDLNALQDLDSYPWSPIAKDVFGIYQEKLRKLNALDFSDLLLKTYELLKSDTQVRELLQNQFKYILVDEYQDTNLIQYEMIKLLSKDKENVCAVGDEDQSIYSWRGANIFNILNFDKDFPETRIIKLEQNYRSTKNIIGAASAVIENNSQRKGKKLFTDNPDGDLIELIEGPTEYDEVHSISYQIQKIIEQTEHTYSDISIFYRTNAQSRVFEEKLRNLDIPYRIIGGLKFYDRKEIKDVIAYMRLVVNPKDDVAFRRVFNTPTRGLGKTTLEKIEALAIEMDISMVEASIHICDSVNLTARTKTKVQAFLNILTQLRESCLENTIYDFYQDLLQISQYMPTLEKEETVEAGSRIQNLEEFANAIARYLELHPDEDHITQFLHHMALVTDADSKEQDPNSVTLMTLHIAKGLEYPVVFVTGMEEGLFPNAMRMDGNDSSDMELEEERRLFYVGITRAKQSLYLTYAKQRKVWGQNQYQAPSRFLNEIPEKFMKQRINPKKPSFNDRYGSKSFSSKAADPFPDYESGDSEDQSPYQKGLRVYHPQFGSGVVFKIEGQGSKEKVSILFDDKTLKKFLSQYANLEMN